MGNSKGNIWVKSELLQALDIPEISFTSISSMLSKSGAKAPEAFDSLFKKLFTKQNNIWVKSELLQALEVEEIYFINISGILNTGGAKVSEAFDSLCGKLLTRDSSNRWVKSKLLQALDTAKIPFSSISNILGGTGGKGAETFDALCSKLLTRDGNSWVKSEQLQTLEIARISFSNISHMLSKSGIKSAKVFDSLFNKLFTKQDNIWVKSELLQNFEEEGIFFSSISSILNKSRAKAPEALDSLFEKLFSLNPEFTALNNSANKYIPSEMLTAFKKVGAEKIFSILHGAGINADKACQKLLELLFIKQNNEYILIPNLDPNSVDRQVVIQLINHKKSAAVNAPDNSPANFPTLASLFGDDHNYDDDVFHNFLVGAGSQQLPVLLPEDIDNIINDFNDPDNLEINIEEIENIPAEEIINYFDNLEDPSEDQSMGEYNLAGQCSSGVGRYKRFVGNVCIIDSSNHEKFENEESYTKLAKVWQSNHDPLTHDILPPDTLPPDTQNRLGTIALDSLNNLGRGMQEAFNMFMFVKDISKKDPEGLAKDIGILYGIPKATEFIEQKLMQLTEQYPSFNNLLKGGRVGAALNLGLNINDLQNSIKSLEDAPDQYTKSIAEIRITADGGLIAFSVIDLLSLFLEGAAVTSGVGAIAAICVTIASTLATSNIEARKICDELECVGQEYRDIFGTLLLDKPLADNIKNDLQAKEIYGKWLDIMGQMLVNMTGFDAYVTTLPTISIERVQTYTGTLKVMSTPRLSYCDISTSQEATLIEHIPSSAHILSLSNSLKYSGHSRILKLPSDNIKLACNPTASDVQVIDNIRPAANDPGYLQYSKQASVCGSCEQVPTSDIAVPGQQRYNLNYNRDWLCKDHNIPCISPGSSLIYYNQVQDACSRSNGVIKSKYEIKKLVLGNNIESSPNVTSNICDNSIVLIESSAVDKFDSDITVLYQDLNLVRAADNKNSIIVKNAGSYFGGNNNDIFLSPQEINKVLIDGKAGQNTLILEGNLLPSSNCRIANIENLLGTSNSQRVNIYGTMFPDLEHIDLKGGKDIIGLGKNNKVTITLYGGDYLKLLDDPAIGVNLYASRKGIGDITLDFNNKVAEGFLFLPYGMRQLVEIIYNSSAKQLSLEFLSQANLSRKIEISNTSVENQAKFSFFLQEDLRVDAKTVLIPLIQYNYNQTIQNVKNIHLNIDIQTDLNNQQSEQLIERLIRLNNSNFTISFTVQTKTTKYIIENHSNKHYISIRQSEGTDKKSLYLSLNAGDDIYFIDDYNHITINSTTSTNNQTLSDLIVFQLPTNELLNIRCLGQGIM